jgi:hypothetical protein
MSKAKPPMPAHLDIDWAQDSAEVIRAKTYGKMLWQGFTKKDAGAHADRIAADVRELK